MRKNGWVLGLGVWVGVSAGAWAVVTPGLGVTLRSTQIDCVKLLRPGVSTQDSIEMDVYQQDRVQKFELVDVAGINYAGKMAVKMAAPYVFDYNGNATQPVPGEGVELERLTFARHADGNRLVISYLLKVKSGTAGGQVALQGEGVFREGDWKRFQDGYDVAFEFDPHSAKCFERSMGHYLDRREPPVADNAFMTLACGPGIVRGQSEWVTTRSAAIFRGSKRALTFYGPGSVMDIVLGSEHRTPDPK